MTARTMGARRIPIETEQETVTANVPLAVIGVRGRETKRRETGLSVMEGDEASILEHT